MLNPAECPHDFSTGGTGKPETCTECGHVFPPCDPVAATYIKRVYREGLRVPGIANFPEHPLWNDCKSPLEVTDDILQRAKEIIATTPVRATGYHIKVLLIESDKGLEAGEAAAFPTLAKIGLETKSEKQKSRESRGTDTALVVDIGYSAFNNKEHLGDKPWVQVGHIIKIVRYTGHSFEEPVGSGKRYAILNDEDCLGYYETRVNA